MAVYNVTPEQLAQMLRSVPERASNVQPVANAYREIFRSRVAQHFKDESSLPAGVAWDPLQDSTAEKKMSKAKGARKRGYHPILTATGQMRRTVGAEGRRDGVAIGSPKPYAKYHQSGTSRMPARPFLVFQKSDVAAFMRAVNAHLFGVNPNG